MNGTMRWTMAAAAAAAVWAPAAGAGAPMDLDACIAAALRANPGLAGAARRADAARAAVDQAQSAWWPRASLGGQYALTDNPPQAFMMELNQRSLNMADPGFNPNEPDATDNLRLTAGARYRLFDRSRGAQRDMARAGAAAAEQQLAAARNELVHQVTRAYYGVLQARAFVAVQAEAVRSLEENLRVAQERFAAGAVVKTDVLNLEVQLAQGREDLIRARHGVQLAAAALRAAVGADGIEAAEAPPPDTAAAPAPLAPDAAAIEKRPELEAALRMAALRLAEVRKSAAQFGPTLSAFGSYDWDASPGDAPEGSYLVGLAAEWDVFTGGQRGAAWRQAVADWKAAEADVARARNELRLDAEQARLQQADAWERLGVARKSLESAEEALRITEDRYQKGAAPITELLVAQVGRTATRTRLTAAYYEYRTAQSNVARAAGELARRYGDEGGDTQGGGR